MGGYDDAENTHYSRTGLVSSLPSVTFSNPNSSDILKLEYAQRETTNLDQMEYHLSDSAFNKVYSKIVAVNLREIFQKATEENKYFLTISIEQEYFEN